MHHLAIMRKSWKLIDKILKKEKTIESRWYKARFNPWNNISAGDTVFFKDAACPVSAKARVKKVLQFDNYSNSELKDILNKYSKSIAFVSNPREVFNWAKKRKYCILIFLENPETITPFNINKKGFGNACAWISIENINKIRI